MQTLSHTPAHKTSTTDMEVTSIRLERELKDHLKQLAGGQGYQALIREILWNFVRQKSNADLSQWSRQDIRASVEAIACKEEQCALTGTVIQPHEKMLLGWTNSGDIIPLSLESLGRE